jgi:hypothetical protein
MSYINHRKPYGSDTKLYTRVGEKEAGFVLGDDREEIRCKIRRTAEREKVWVGESEYNI